MNLTSTQPEKVLVLAAHPDDEVLGCGGTIARLSQEGHEVHIAILGEGITSRYENPSAADKALLQQLESNCQKAAEIMGAKELHRHNFPDNRLDSVDLLDVVKVVEDLIDKVEPAVVYTQHGGDLNIDHVCLYRATLTATRPMAGTPVKALYAYEVASSSEWAFQRFSPQFHPNAFVDIASTLEVKVQAMQAYESESRPFPHPRSPEALRVQAQRWGATVGVGAAEAFELIRSIA